MLLRAERPADESTLRHLAALDSARPLKGHALLAEVDGRAIAALDLDDGRVVADPFVRTAAAVEMLRMRADRMQPETTERRRGLLHRFRAAGAPSLSS
jgi:hypothetical protein